MPAVGDVVGLIGWAVVALIGAVMVTQVLAWDRRRTIAIVQSLTPYLALLVVPVVVYGGATGRTALAIVAGAVGVAAALLARPLLFAGSPPAAEPGMPGLRIAAVNLLYDNDRIDELADDLLRLDVDVIVFCEYTEEHATALVATRLAARFEHRIDRPRPGARGGAVWSASPLDVAGCPDTINATIDVRLPVGHHQVRVIAVHPPSPVADVGGWRRDLAIVGDAGTATGEPTVVIGDFNASFWHPSFRSLLDDGYTDAHIALRKGFSSSWPTNSVCPAFVRLDHALTTGGLRPVRVEDFDVTGSDHLGFVVTVTPAR